MNKITNFICLSLLLLGASAQGMDNPVRAGALGVQLLDVVRDGKFAEAKRLIAAKANIEMQDEYWRTPLMVAARNGHENVYRLLIANKASVEVKDKSGMTLLHLAALGGHEAMCELLIANKASVDLKDDNGVAPLHFAARNDHDGVCKLLINIQLESARENKAAIMTFLGIARKKRGALLRAMPYDIAKIIARYALEIVRQDKLPVIEQLHYMDQAKWLAYLNDQMNSPIK